MSSHRYFKAHTNKSLESFMGQWINLDTTFGGFQGIVEEVSNDAVLLKMPISSMPNHSSYEGLNADVALAGYGYPQPYRVCGPWWWCWFPFVFILILPFFCW